jgi:hypothetical protein
MCSYEELRTVYCVFKINIFSYTFLNQIT